MVLDSVEEVDGEAGREALTDAVGEPGVDGDGGAGDEDGLGVVATDGDADGGVDTDCVLVGVGDTEGHEGRATVFSGAARQVKFSSKLSTAPSVHGTGTGPNNVLLRRSTLLRGQEQNNGERVPKRRCGRVTRHATETSAPPPPSTYPHPTPYPTHKPSSKWEEGYQRQDPTLLERTCLRTLTAFAGP